MDFSFPFHDFTDYSDKKISLVKLTA
jgi:hypothetical protein